MNDLVPLYYRHHSSVPMDRHDRTLLALLGVQSGHITSVFTETGLSMSSAIKVLRLTCCTIVVLTI
jgi:hypothetical protein